MKITNTSFEMQLLDQFMARKDFSSAKNLAHQLLIGDANNPEILTRLGLIAADEGNFSVAEDLFLKSLEIKSDQVVAIFSLGRIALDLGRYSSALFFFERTLALNESHYQTNLLTGETLSQLTRFSESEIYFQRCIEINPNLYQGYLSLANCYKSQKRFELAVEYYEKSKQLNLNIPGVNGNILSMKMYLSDWSEYSELVRTVLSDAENCKFSMDPFHFLSVCDNPELIKKYISALEEKRHLKSADLVPYINKKIKIGYFSADFYNHATMHLMADVFKHHDREKFEIYAFSFNPPVDDEWKELVKGYFDEFIDISTMSDSEAAELSKSKKIDIAVDLKGHTQFARTRIFANRAAPIQVNYLGYPGSMGSSFMDYIIGDDIVIPKENKKYFSEKVANLTMCYQPNMAEREISEIAVKRSDFGLPEDVFVYCSFNNNYKVSEQMFDCWMDILRQTENSVLWMLVADKKAQENLATEAIKRDIQTHRIIFAHHIPIKEHLKRITLADLVLDTFPYNGHTTSSDAIRMGLPIVTLMGNAFQSRVAASLLTEINMPELITKSLEDYKSLAIKLGSDKRFYKEIKNKFVLNKEKSDLFKPDVFTKKLELCFLDIMQRETAQKK